MTSIKKYVGDGFVLVDKPINLSSHQAIKAIKKLCTGKIGHSGTLDPFATGMLVVSVGQASKFMQYQIIKDKTYSASLQLGIQTDTQDCTGKIIKQAPIPKIENATIHNTLLTYFTGEIEQVASKFSALKHKGKPSYKYARAGIDIPEKKRKITIHGYDKVAYDPKLGIISFQVTCSSGTYIRALGEDIAKKLGSYGHITQLRRLSVHPWQPESMHLPSKFQENTIQNFIQPIDMTLLHLPRLELSTKEIEKLKMGQWINAANDSIDNSLYRTYDTKQKFCGLVRCKMPYHKPQKMLISSNSPKDKA
ncbi:MAG: tRNA pseudouridine(55) synthase TruB [Pseudomonadota bacterium]|nr:tRNA pseudouridine(55) synthase TruB [Pseudomonadota bacterium]